MDEEKFLLVRQKVRAVYEKEKKEHLFKQIVIVTNNTVFPLKNLIVSKLVNAIEEFFIKGILKKDFLKYKRSLKSCDMTSLKKISKKYDIDLARLNGYSKYICDTKDEYLKSTIDKIFSYY